MVETKNSQRTLLGFDFGTKRIGVAIAQELTGTANPLTTLKAVKNKPDWQNITKIINEWQPDLLIIGLPLHMDGSEQPMTAAAKRFSNQLNGRYNIPIALMDERLSSNEAKSIIKERTNASSVFQHKEQIDMISAQLILQSWITQKDDDK